MGAWRSIRHRLDDAARGTGRVGGVGFVGRPWRASPSEGYPTAHAREQDRIVREPSACPPRSRPRQRARCAGPRRINRARAHSCVRRRQRPPERGDAEPRAGAARPGNRGRRARAAKWVADEARPPSSHAEPSAGKVLLAALSASARLCRFIRPDPVSDCWRPMSDIDSLFTRDPGSPRAQGAQLRARSGHAARSVHDRGSVREPSLFKSEEQARIEETLDGTEPAVALVSPRLPWPGEETGRRRGTRPRRQPLGQVAGVRLGRLSPATPPLGPHR